MIIADTSAWIDFLVSRDTPVSNRLRTALITERVGVPDFVLCEVLQGIREDRFFKEVEERLVALGVLHCSGQQLMILSASNYRLLRSRGLTIRSTIDCILATYCIVNDYALLHHDRDFDPFEQHLGLRVIRP